MKDNRRTVQQCLESGYVTPIEKQGIDFLSDLEDNEKHMAEGAAMAVTCEQHGIDWGDQGDVMFGAPSGEWWRAAELPVKERAE